MASVKSEGKKIIMRHECTFWRSPVGMLKIEEEEGRLIRLRQSDESGESALHSRLQTEVIRQLEEYLTGRRKVIDLPLILHGTDFQRKVWHALTEIPYGETRTYKEIAKIVDSPRAARAVGRACHANPIAIIVPCHRVIGTDGKLTGYAGGLEMKQKLLDLEKNRSKTQNKEK